MVLWSNRIPYEAGRLQDPGKPACPSVNLSFPIGQGPLHSPLRMLRNVGRSSGIAESVVCPMSENRSRPMIGVRS